MNGNHSKTIFAKNLAYYLNRSGKSQTEMAELLDVPVTTFNCWLNGKRYPRIDKIEMMSNYFGILKSDLIEEKTDTDGADLSVAKRKIIDIVKECTDEDAERLLAMMQLFLNQQ